MAGGDKNRTGTPYKDIYELCEKYKTGIITAQSLAAFCWIENRFNTDSSASRDVQTLFQLKGEYPDYDKILKSLNTTKTPSDKCPDCQDWQPTNTLFAKVVPKIQGGFSEFVEKSGFSS